MSLHNIALGYDEEFKSASVDLTERWELVLEAQDDKLFGAGTHVRTQVQ